MSLNMIAIAARDDEACVNLLLYRKSGIACIGKKGSPEVELYVDSMNANGVANERLSAQELNRRYPKQFNIPTSSVCVFERDGGVLKATKAVRALQVCPSDDMFTSACMYMFC